MNGDLTRQVGPRDRIGLHVTLFLLTLATTTLVGAEQYDAYVSDFSQTRVPLPPWMAMFVGGESTPWLTWLGRGLWYSLAVIAILGAHEAGHYLACRYYGIQASLPYFIPLPPLTFTGTLGAFIRIRSPFSNKRELFDVAVAGPIAGFLVAVPVLLLGLSLSRIVPFPERFVGYNLGEPLLWKWAVALTWNTPAQGYNLNIHPTAWAAWLGLLVTAINLIPFKQLDGGHLAYAVFGRRSSWVTILSLITVIALTVLSINWLLWAILFTVAFLLFGPRHPDTPDHDHPLDATRLVIALVAVAMFVVCFTPAPIEVIELIGGKPVG